MHSTVLLAPKKCLCNSVAYSAHPFMMSSVSVADPFVTSSVRVHKHHVVMVVRIVKLGTKLSRFDKLPIPHEFVKLRAFRYDLWTSL